MELALRDSHLVVTSRGLVHLLRPGDGIEERRFDGWSPLDSVGNGTLFAYQGLGSGEIILEDVRTNDRTTFVVPALPGSEAPDVTALAIIENPQAVIVTTADGRLLRFDRGRQQPTYAFEAHGAVIRTVTMSRDNTLCATGSADRSIRIWHADTGQLEATLSGHTGSVQALAFSHDGRTLASGGGDGTVRLWNLHARLETVTFGAHQRDLHPGVTALAFTPRDAHLVSAGALGTVVRWDTDTARQVSTLRPKIRK
jgi:WD40 repeat protein